MLITLVISLHRCAKKCSIRYRVFVQLLGIPEGKLGGVTGGVVWWYLSPNTKFLYHCICAQENLLSKVGRNLIQILGLTLWCGNYGHRLKMLRIKRWKILTLTKWKRRSRSSAYYVTMLQVAIFPTLPTKPGKIVSPF